jgi:hypothetical protein
VASLHTYGLWWRLGIQTFSAESFGQQGALSGGHHQPFKELMLVMANH